MAGAIRLICPNLRCRSVLTVPSSARGKKVRCSQCGIRIGIPAENAMGKKKSQETEDEQVNGKDAA